jgi:methionine--tRNA ligase beta chain
MLKEIEHVASSPPASKHVPQPPPPPPPAPEPVDVSKLDIRVAKILSVAPAPNSEKLYLCQVDVGEEVPRQFCTGLRPFLPPERLLNRFAIALCNLKLVRLAGNNSAGMLLAATEGNQVDLINPPPGTTAGQPVVCPDYRGPPAEPNVLHKRKMLPAIMPDLQARDGVAYYRNTPLQVLGVNCTSTLTGPIS